VGVQQTETLDPQKTEPREVALIGVLSSVAAIGEGQNLFCDGNWNGHAVPAAQLQAAVNSSC
jgi:hypothetical protein